MLPIEPQTTNNKEGKLFPQSFVKLQRAAGHGVFAV
ncbi:MAG: hypothetical protein PWP23_3075, partial [Candidatus Sumerlaeota bacterium]|nr:hypothetical protein [Candidatus Sumerlaeota bacterium]